MMNVQSLASTNMAGRIAAIAALLLAACTPFNRTAPQQVEASNPTVSYAYRSDDELIQTNQLAQTFCSQYQLVPRALGFSRGDAGKNLVNFECVPTLAPAESAVNPNLTYTYRDDDELLDLSRDAHSYCLHNGSSRVTSDIVSNVNGTRTVTFRCNPS